MQLKIQQYCTPAKVRMVFKLRPYKNFAIGLGIFIAICLLLLTFLNVWVASGIAFLPAFGVYLFLESRGLIIMCPSCEHDVDTNTPWLCGYKKCRNENIDHQHPFINECEHCHYIPKAYKCHHCGEPIYLTTDRQNVHIAQCLSGIEPMKPKPRDARGEKITGQVMKEHDLEHQLRVTTLEKEIEIVKNKPAVPVIKSANQAMEDEIETCVNQGMTIFDVEKRLKEKADVEFANDEHKRQQKYALIDNEIRKRID